MLSGVSVLPSLRYGPGDVYLILLRLLLFLFTLLIG